MDAADNRHDSLSQDCLDLLGGSSVNLYLNEGCC